MLATSPEAPPRPDEPPAAGGAPRPIIALEGVTRRFAVGRGVVDALVDVDLVVRPGEFVVVLGPSGSGKTTLLNLIGALDTPSEGRITVAGRELAGLSRSALSEVRRHTVTFIFQAFNLFPSLTALENVRFGADVAGRTRPDDLARGILAEVGLAERLDHFPASSTSARASQSSSCCAGRRTMGGPCLSSRTIARSAASPTGWSS
jgi:putative ABC transport system ATP-binding protein